MEAAFDGISGALDEVLKDVRAKFQEASKHAGIVESLQAFIAAVDWTVRGSASSIKYHAIIHESHV